jgi:hypothetical protein
MIEAPDMTPEQIAGDPAKREQLEQRFGSDVPAGYTYFGQFIDHDITFDPVSSLARRHDPNAIHNFRTPRLDLDSVYGRGPHDQPYLYDQRKGKEGKLLIGEVSESKLRDLPRNLPGTALIGDMRNDENAIVSQLHLAFLLAHNTLVERAAKMPDPFEAARRTLQWLYQYLVWNDFLKKLTREEVHKRALERGKTPDGRTTWQLGLKEVYSWRRQPFIPVEFSAAAYRFGHSMVRNEYRTNESHRTFQGFAPLFDSQRPARREDLHGFGPLDKLNAVQWDWFLPLTSSSTQSGFPQKARRIDTKLSNSLAHLHAAPDGNMPMNVLAYRNLKRGLALGLPAGTAMARKYGVDEIKLEKEEPDSLWYYILREAEQLGDPNRSQLGPLGSIIICATFAGLLQGDPSSYLNIEPGWTPAKDLLLRKGFDNIDGEPADGPREDRSWTLASIIRIAGLPTDTEHFGKQIRGDFTNPFAPSQPADAGGEA